MRRLREAPRSRFPALKNPQRSTHSRASLRPQGSKEASRCKRMQAACSPSRWWRDSSRWHSWCRGPVGQPSELSQRLPRRSKKQLFSFRTVDLDPEAEDIDPKKTTSEVTSASSPHWTSRDSKSSVCAKALLSSRSFRRSAACNSPLRCARRSASRRSERRRERRTRASEASLRRRASCALAPRLPYESYLSVRGQTAPHLGFPTRNPTTNIQHLYIHLLVHLSLLLPT